MSNSIETNPNPSQILTIIYNSNDITIEWEKSTEWDFKSYTLQYKTHIDPNNENDESWFNTFISTEIQDSLYQSSNFPPNLDDSSTPTYWFRMKIEDVWGLSSFSSVANCLCSLVRTFKLFPSNPSKPL